MTHAAAKPGLLTQAAVLIGISLALGGAAQIFSPTRIPWHEDWSRYVESKALQVGLRLAAVEDVRAMVEQNTHLLLDARSVADYDRGHIPGALSLPQTQLDTYYPEILPLLTPDQPLLVYCSGLECDESLLLSAYLREQGFTNVTLFVGGYQAWSKAASGSQEPAP